MFLNLIKGSDLSLKLRNSLNIKPINIILPNDGKSYSISDAFCWRSSNNFKTNFRYTDLVNYFLNLKNIPIKLVVSNHCNEIIKIITLKQNQITDNIDFEKQINDIKINSGHFFIFHKVEPIKDEPVLLRNSCYTSYSYKGRIPSVVHGNLPVVAENEFSIPYKKNIIQYSFIKNYIYKVQHNFSSYDKVEAFIFNPVRVSLKIFINEMPFTLNPHNSMIIKLPKSDVYTIKSKCLLLRPLFFVYKKNNFDIFHG